MGEVIKVGKVTVHIPTEQYGFLECELEGVGTFDKALELAKNMKTDAMKSKYGCEHMFAKTIEGKSKKTFKPYVMLKCPECGSVCFKNEDSSFGSWQYPVSGKGV